MISKKVDNLGSWFFWWSIIVQNWRIVWGTNKNQQNLAISYPWWNTKPCIGRAILHISLGKQADWYWMSHVATRLNLWLLYQLSQKTVGLTIVYSTHLSNGLPRFIQSLQSLSAMFHNALTQTHRQVPQHGTSGGHGRDLVLQLSEFRAKGRSHHDLCVPPAR